MLRDLIRIIKIMFIAQIFFCYLTVNATESSCTHNTYNTNLPDTYHYTYCEICNKCIKREKHAIDKKENYNDSSKHKVYCSCGYYMGTRYHNYSYSKYNSGYHKATCGCGYSGLKAHSEAGKIISMNEIIDGAIYNDLDSIDTYHRSICGKCNEDLGVSKHDWTGGDITVHKCSTCSYIHSKSTDATQGLHYFDIEKIRVAGEVGPCVVCGKKLKLEYTDDTILTKLPKKEEYTMVGNPNPMKEVELSTDQTIKTNYMPINENGEIIPLDDLALRVRKYTNGNYFNHYSKLMGREMSSISNRIDYVDNPETIEYIATKLSKLGTLGGYNEQEKMQIIAEVNQEIKNNPQIGWIDTYALVTLISEMGDFAIGAINTPLIEWFTRDLIIKDTWLAGDVATLRHDFNGSMTDPNSRKYTVYFSELPVGKYEIVFSNLLTYGVDFNLFSYSIGGITQMLYSTLFTVGGGGGDNPVDINAYISIAYRDINGNVILDKTGNIGTPIDALITNVVYSGTSARSVTSNICAEMEWTQNMGYRYKGYLIKYGNSSSGNYGIYNVPSEMTVTTNSSVSVTSSFSYEGLRN